MWIDLTPPKKTGGGQNWLLTFTDLVALLVCFFVLIFSTKSMDSKRWEEIAGALRGTFSVVEAAEVVQPTDLANAENTPIALSDGLGYLKALLARRLAADDVWAETARGNATTYNKTTRSLRYPLPALALADTTALARLAEVIRNWDNTIHLVLRTPPEVLDNPLLLEQAAQTYVALTGYGVALKQADILPATPEAPAGIWLEVLGK